MNKADRQKVLLISDIYGLSDSIEYIKNELEQLGCTVIVLDPYHQKPLNFENEQKAYEAFCQSCGHSRYYQLGIAALKQFQPTVIVGFSAGASCAWRLSSEKCTNVQSVVCFYPTKIRDYLDIKPQVTTTVILPRFESMFEVRDVAQALLNVDKVDVIQVDYLHGFMNQHSDGFKRESLNWGTQQIAAQLKKAKSKDYSS